QRLPATTRSWRRLEGSRGRSAGAPASTPYRSNARCRCGSAATVRRAAQYGNGWIVAGDYLGGPPDDDARQMLDWLHEEEVSAGRPVGSLGVQGVFTIGQKTEAEWVVRLVSRYHRDSNGRGARW